MKTVQLLFLSVTSSFGRVQSFSLPPQLSLSTRNVLSSHAHSSMQIYKPCFHRDEASRNHIQMIRTSASPIEMTRNSNLPISVKTVSIGTDSTDMLDLASFRNNCTSPLQMIQKQEAKKAAIDLKDALLEGIKIGLFAGVAVFGITFANEHDVTNSLKSFVAVSASIGGMLSINNLTGNRVYVYSEAEATNRLTVDFVSMLKTGDDVGFIAKLNTQDVADINYGRYSGTNGVVACVDGQLRNSQMGGKPSFAASKKYGNLPSHFHIKNMLVDDGMRRQGIAKKLIFYVEDFARTKTDANILTLEVDPSNTAAVDLYETQGFITGDTMGASDYGALMSGRKFMTKQL